MAALRRKFIERSATRVEALRDAIEALDSGDAEAALETLKAEAHKLLGSGATFGLPLVSEAAASLEDCVGKTPRDVGRMRRLVDTIGNIIEDAGDQSTG